MSNGYPWNIYTIGGFAVLGTRLFATVYGAVLLTTDDGASWSYDTTGLSSQLIGPLTVSGSNIFAGTSNFGIFLSTDSGRSWAAQNSSLPSIPFMVLAVSGANLFAGTYDRGVLLSTDNGKSWSTINAGLSVYNPVDAFAVIGDHIFAGANSGGVNSGGVFLTSNNGTSWQNVSAGLTDSNVLALKVVGDNLYAGTMNSGVWRRPLSDFGISSVTQTPTMHEFDIRSYPNPFSQSTEINFTSQAAGYAEVSIVNLLGAEVAHLFSGELAAGEHSFEWSKPAGLPDEVYECLVRMNGHVETLPMVLAR